MGRKVVGSAIGVALTLGLGAAMVPIRSHLSIATAGLVLVVPVVAGVVVGGYPAGLISVAAGFLVYDLIFIPPYYTLSVGAAQNWVALAVYVVVMVLVARVVSHFEQAKEAAQHRESETRRLFELSEMLVEDRSTDELLRAIVEAVQTVFSVGGVALLLPAGPQLEVAAAAGTPLSDSERRRLARASGTPVRMGTLPGQAGELGTVSLSVAGRPVGILAVRDMPAADSERELLRAFANHAAAAIERSRLREQALRTELLEEVDRLRRALLGAVSHDLRTPLATMKVASSTLLESGSNLSADDARELYTLLDMQTDRLSRLVTSLLDLTRYEAGVLEVRREPWTVTDLVLQTTDAVRFDKPIEVDVPDDLPKVSVDPTLIGQVLVNLLDNAERHAPPGTPITIAGRLMDGRVVLSVEDEGPGVSPADRQVIFEKFIGFDTGERAGLGLAIAKSFVEAHGERIWVEERARFCFTLATA
jgi:two-component system sensor histidine kinase KdpD